ncbi:MAG: hypothetical protein P8M11_06835 [Planctomycetota bacterium]|jgi:hypothetical protein|nr:hypothetical protein [Planctomycetota bacterium]MDG1984262.1 hypothetical protein [Planctomycetota bacterium]
MNRLLHSLAIAIASGGVALAQQPSIYVDIGSVSGGAGTPATTFGAAASVGGFWNNLNLDNFGPVLVSPPLSDIGGSATAVTLTWDGLGFVQGSVFRDQLCSTGDDQALMDDCGFIGGPSQFRFDGLPGGTYTVLTYAMAPEASSFLTNVAVPGSADPAQDVGGDFCSGYLAGITHAEHTVTVGAGQALVIDIAVTSWWDSLNGIQLFPVTGPSFGTSFCGPAVTNSSGAPAVISVTGTPVASLNDFTLVCSSMPANSLGFFLVSQSQGFVANPGGSQGNLCLGGAIGRYVGTGQILNSGASGEIMLPADLTMIPSPTGFIAAAPGDVFNFSTWFRDSSMGSAASNFSQGVEVTFQ